MENIRQDLTGYRMPAYMEEILTENYCGNFMKMSIVRDGGHVQHWEQLEAYNKVTLDFLLSHRENA